MTRHRITVFSGLFGLLVLAGCHNGPFDEAAGSDPLPAATTTIAEVRQTVGNGTLHVTGDLVVSGTVTSTDRRLAFYHTLYIESDGAALALMAGVDRLHADYPAGCRVAVRLQGLTLGTYRGVLQAGTRPEPGSYYPTGYLASPAAVAAHLFRSDEVPQPPVPTQRTVGELRPELGGTLVRIDGLRHLPEAEAVSWAGTHPFEDETGRLVYSYVRSSALFAGKAIPEGRGSLTGILLYEAAADRYLIQMRDEEDLF